THVAAGVMAAVMKMPTAGIGMSRTGAARARIPAGVSAERSGAWLRAIAMPLERRRLMPGRCRVSSGLRRVRRAGLAIDRGDLAGPHRLDAGASLLDQLLENPVEGAAVRLIAERAADVTARERLGEERQRRADVSFQLSDAPAPGSARKRRNLLLRRRWRRSGLRGDEGLQLSSGLDLEHPHQIESLDLRLVGGFQQLDSGAELLLQPPLVQLVLIACHSVHNHSTIRSVWQDLRLARSLEPSPTRRYL